MTKTPHKHAALIKAWADGATIEILLGSRWRLKTSPHWDADYEYRIKPETEPDVVVNALMKFHNAWKTPSIHISWNGTIPEGYKHNLSLGLDCIAFTFDGETNKLKSVEIIK